ncbi:MAG: DUF4080 domain-containing protein [Planctomycetaceae bacterium]|nr:DUF4080 domain-containing protein [Planctomycetaceae bacterium]
MPDIVLTTLNARYWHSSFGLRYLLANMGELTDQTTLLEFGIGDRTVDIIDTLLQQQPKIVGIGVYIWNVDVCTQLVLDLKRVAPHITVVLGGPEVSYETAGQPIVAAADHVITGEADLAFPALCREVLRGPSAPALAADETSQEPLLPVAATPGHIIAGGVPALADIRLPYHLYNDEDISNRVIYVEVSRGCPFTCEFCLSALDIPVRLFDVNEFLAAMQDLLARGAKQFKFVDRTFNLNMRVSTAILEFFLHQLTPGLFLHFEMIPDRLPDNLRDLIAKFPDGVLQFEIGVQTFNDEVGELISRRQDNRQLAENFRYLREETGVHIHADLIIGLPGEDVDSFARGLDQLVALNPQEIQIGILKRLKGTPITRHDDEWQMVYSSHPPFEILANRLIDFAMMQRLRRLSRYWDLVVNNGNFQHTYPLLWQDDSPFAGFLAFSDWLFATLQKSHGIPLAKLAERLFRFLVEERGQPVDVIALSVWSDYVSGGRRDRPAFLRNFDLPPAHELHTPNPTVEAALPSRQARHVQQTGR